MLSLFHGINSLAKKGLAVKDVAHIVPVNGIYAVDKNGYVGYDLKQYFRYAASETYAYALVIDGADFSDKDLGQVVFVGTTNVIGGRTYKTVIIGGKEWMAENLDYKFPGINIHTECYQTIDSNSAVYYDFDEATYGFSGNKYGLLYSIRAIDAHRTSFAPGWHVPTSDDWTALCKALRRIDLSRDYGETCKELKSKTDWQNYTESGVSYDGNGIDKYGLNFFPAGYYHNNGFSNIGISCRYRTNYYNTSSSLGIFFMDNRRNLYINNSSYFMQPTDFVSVRLVKD